MTAVEELNSRLEELRAVVEEEKRATSMDMVLKPSEVDNILKAGFEHLDTLNVSTLEKYLGTFSQHLIYINKYLNQLTVAKICAEEIFKKHLNVHVLSISTKEFGTLEERKSVAMKNDDLIAIKRQVDTLNSRIAANKNIPESLENLIQTIKKVYDARIKEKYAKSE